MKETANGAQSRSGSQALQVSLPIRISDVTGLSAALSQINTTLSEIARTVNNLNTTVNNLSATIKNFAPVPTFVDFERPAGAIDGSNSMFVLNASPLPASSLVLCRNGMKLSPAGDYSLAGSTIVFIGGAVPQTGDLLAASYRR
jgi:hypothetical protein